MSTNLRLSEEAAAALREASARSGRSQQELIREAVDRYLGRTGRPSSRRRAVDQGLVKPPTPFRDVAPFIEIDESTASLLDRDDDR